MITDATGSIVIPSAEIGFGVSLVARRADDALAWEQISNQDPRRASATQSEPIMMRLQPLTHRVEGLVVDEQRKPVAEAAVVTRGLSQAGTDSAPQKLIVFFGLLEAFGLPRTRTDQAGRFTLVLPQGAVATLGVRHPRYISPNASADPGARRLDPIVLEPTGTIAGRIVDGSTGQPVPHVRLGAQLIEYRSQIRGGWGEAEADDQGRFAITSLEAGVYNLDFESAPGRPRATAKAAEGVRVRAGQSTAALVKVIEGRPLRGVVINESTKQPVAGIQVGCYGPARPQSGAHVQSQKTDLQGASTLWVPPGEHFVYIMDGISFSRLSKCTIDVPEHGEVTPIKLIQVTESAQPQLKYLRKAAVPNEVAPAPEASVKMKIEATKAAAPPAQLGSAKGTAIAKAEGAQSEPRPELAVRTVTGRVRDPQGQPVVGVRVQQSQNLPHRAPPRQFPNDAVTDREGIFVLDGVPRQPVQVYLSRTGFNSQPEDLPADRDDVQFTCRLTPDFSSRHRLIPRGDDHLPADVRERLSFIELTHPDTVPLGEGPGGSGNDLNRVPRGIRDCNGVYCRVGQNMVHLAGTATPDLPHEVKGIQVQAHGRKLYFLHAVQQAVAPGTEVGAYLAHYADGSTERIPVVYGRDLLNWWRWVRGPEEPPTEAKVAWKGTNDVVEMNQEVQVRLFSRTWINPHPEKVVASLDFASTGTLCDPFLVAVTLERDR